MTENLNANQTDRAATLLREDALVAFPTETVYGLGANALSDAAVAKIFEAKNRPSFNPLIVHLPDLQAAEVYVDLTPEARIVAQAFWPGPLSLVLPLKPNSGLSPLVTAGLDTVAIRVPAHPLAQEILRRANLPIAAPSANPSGRVSPTTAQHVRDGLAGRIAAVIDGGACTVGLESTILGGDPLQLLRPGGVAREQIEALLDRALRSPIHDTNAPNAPGQLSSHYAPETGVRLNVAQPQPGIPHLGFGESNGVINLSRTGDLTEAAARLFSALREMDAITQRANAPHFTVAPIPQAGLGAAINDRLTRAAAPR